MTYGNRVIVEEPDGSNEDVADEIERIENLIGELDSSLMSERTSEWMISLAPADDRAAGITQGCVYCIAGAPCESDHSDGLT